ncbi:unnamed protein product [Rhizoctonia solani]|uniref:C2H2-type domain-containing protein n=1 Tax=Rhizoctonia solani TaxID=456999 RepID=A0A8H3BP63_9AGAM|nr:unnamed protein product [Rhizoctonia solani]
MTEDVPPRGRASHSLAVYHVPDISPPLEGLRAQSSTFTTRNSTVAQDRPALASIYPSHPPTTLLVEESIAKPVARRVMYDPVRDSVTSSPAASPSHTTTTVGQPTPQDGKSKFVYPEISVSPVPSLNVRYPPRSEDHSVSGFSQRLAIANSRPRSLSAESSSCHIFTISKLIRARIIREYSPHHYGDSLTTADQGQLQYAHYARPLETRRTDGSSAVYRTPADTELGGVLQGPHKKYALLSSSRTTSGSTSNKRPYAALEDNVEDRPSRSFSRDINESIYADLKGKRKETVSQSPAFRLDNLLGPATPESPQEQPVGSDGGSERSSSETGAIEESPAETPYVFTGKLPPPPFTGHSSAPSSSYPSISVMGISVSPAPSSSYPSISVMGISVSPDVDLGRFAVPDDFERAVISTQGPITNAMRSTMPSASHSSDLGRFAVPDDFERAVISTQGPITNAMRSTMPSASHSSSNDPGAKLARKHTAQRRKARGLFPQDNVPLAISTTTTKQSRYRPSGDRQPVACGYKDPITGVQCDEPFNRSVELRRHVRYRPSGDRQPVACGYKDPITGVQCDEPFNRSVELRRHVRAVHVPAEALAVTVGQLSRSQATLLPVDWKPGDGGVLRPKCVCGKEFSRLDALRRHWTGVNAEVKDGKCISCPSSIGKKKDNAVYEQQGTEGTYGAPVYS